MKELDLTSMETRILDKARELFLFFGIRSVSMEDIAKHLGITKKTLYTHYRDKNELIGIVVDELISNHSKEIVQANAKSKNAVEDVFLENNAMIHIFNGINSNIFSEIDKYLPEIAHQLTVYRNDHILESIKDNLKRGLSEKVYRANLAIDFIAQVRLNQILSVFKAEVDFPSFTFSHVMQNLSEFYLYGICTSDGRKLIPTYSTQII